MERILSTLIGITIAPLILTIDTIRHPKSTTLTGKALLTAALPLSFFGVFALAGLAAYDGLSK